MSSAIRNRVLAAACLAGFSVTSIHQAAAGDGHRHHVVGVVHLERGGHLPWYLDEPARKSGVGLYYSQHPEHSPGFPQPRTGVAVPIHSLSRPVVHMAPRYQGSAHEAWCAARYRSYDAWSDTYQPYHGARRVCRSP